MSFTQTDLDNIKQAIIDLATGKRVVSITIAGERIDYAPADLDKLRALRAEVMAEISVASNPGGRFCLINTSKGF